MKKSTLFLLSLSLLPVFAHAQTLQSFLGNIIPVINTTVIPFLFGIAFLIFAINVIRFFVIGGSSEDGQEKAKALAMYGVLAFVLIIVFWGVVNLLASSLGLEGEAPVTSDYMNRSGQNNPGNNPSQSPLCQQGALFDENNVRCPSSPLPSNPANPSQSPSPLCQQGALFDENGNRCPSSPLPSNPSTPIAPVSVPPITGPGNPPVLLVDCVLPDGTQVEVSLDDCRARGGVVYN